MSRYRYEITPDEDPTRPDDWDNVAHIVLDVPRYVEVNTAGVDMGALRASDNPAEYLRENYEALAVVPIYAYCHGGVTIRAGLSDNPFSDPWDSGIAGFAFATPETVAATGVASRDLVAAIGQDVETWDQYLTGDVYVITVTDTETGQTVESLCGVYGYGYAETEAVAMVEWLEARDRETESARQARELVAASSWWQD